MSSLKFDLPQLDYTTRFSLWQVKMRAILTQSSDLDEALDGFGKKDAKSWTDDEKRKDRKAFSLIQLHLSNNILQEVLAEKSAAALWLKLESICMSKDLTSKMHVKMKLFSHKLQEAMKALSGTTPSHILLSSVAERMNRTIISKARCMLSNAGMHRCFWLKQPSPLLLDKQSPCIPLDKKTPIEVEHDTEPATYTEAVASVDRVKWISAMQEEMQSLDKNGTWDVVPLPKQKKVVRCKWIFKRKEGLSPNEPPSSIRAFFGIVAMRDLELEQLDVKTAFLHGELEEEIYMDQLKVLLCLSILADPGKEHWRAVQWIFSQSAIYLNKDQMFHERTKHIDIKYHYIRDIVAQGKLKVCKISTHDNPADMMTKPVPVSKFELCSSLVGIT
ncbi:hypothetical protein QYE76_040029 [Lolium multiflorum]|uniref:Retrovirus-related Pol polyprotein from transposon TNT 1-94 n=1 Tax=Lolium multiflorum TaxID=4521 RepID=A0AAD8TCN7_LOLMU|nr:hypothetical protein QYE76_040029 [Lolium multiflorum]